MIQKTDLRIGNTVIYKDHPFTVLGLADVFVVLNIGIIPTLMANGGPKYEDIYPVPLSPSLLVDACGFEKTRDGDFIKAFQELTHHLKLILDTKYEWAYPIICESPEFASQDVNMVSLNRINSLHHLQNIWWSLSQTELQVNISKIV